MARTPEQIRTDLGAPDITAVLLGRVAVQGSGDLETALENANAAKERYRASYADREVAIDRAEYMACAEAGAIEPEPPIRRTAKENEQHLRNRLNKGLERVQAIVPEDVAREELGLEGAEVSIRRSLDFFKRFTPRGLDVLPLSRVDEVSSHLEAFEREVNSLKAFSVDDPHAAVRRQELLDAISNRPSHLHHSLAGVAAYISTEAHADLAGEIAAAKALRVKSEGAVRKLQRTEADVAKVLGDARDAAGKVVSDHYARRFLARAEHHEKEAKDWLKRTKSTLWILLAYCGAMLLLQLCTEKDIGAPYAVQLAVSKAMGFATLASIVVACLRSYQSHLHNAEVNRHREHIMHTFQALVGAGADKGTRDLLLTKAADSVFAAQPTGFGKTDAADPSPLSIFNVSAPRPPTG